LMLASAASAARMPRGPLAVDNLPGVIAGAAVGAVAAWSCGRVSVALSSAPAASSPAGDGASDGDSSRLAHAGNQVADGAVGSTAWLHRGGKRTKVAVLGGAFNPITIAHVQLATEIAHTGLVDEVWLCPCGPRPDKPNMKTSASDRAIMCELAINTMVTPTFPIKVTKHEVDEAMATYHPRDISIPTGILT
jgi:hypothetical protein